MKSKHLLDLFNVAKDYRLFIQMMKDERYRIPLVRKLLYIALVAYIIVPFDFIPGIIPVVGMVDDLGAFAVIVGVLIYEIAAYRDFLDNIKNSSAAPRVEEHTQLPDGDGPKGKSKPAGKE